MLGAQRAQLAHTQTQRVGATEQGARLQVRRARQQRRDLGARQDLGQALGRRGQRDLKRLAVQAQHLAVQEAKRAAVLVDAGAREMALAQQVQQVALHLVGVQLLGAAPVVARQAGNGLDVGLLRALRHAA